MAWNFPVHDIKIEVLESKHFSGECNNILLI